MKKFREYLTDNILNFWLKNAVDEKNGGIFTCLDEKGQIYGREKSVWFQGRALWCFSKAYNIIEKNERFLRAAELIYRFLPKCTDSDGRMFFSVTEDGTGIQKRRYYYSETFAAIGCAEYYKARGDYAAAELAERYFDTAYELFVHPEKSKPKFNPKAAPYKALAPVMIMLSTAQVMRSTGINNEKYNRIASSCAQEILRGGYINREIGALLENVGKNGEFINTPAGRTVNPGHSFEAAWFLMAEGLFSGDKGLTDAGRDIIDFTMPRGLDAVHGGIRAFGDTLDQPPSALEWDMKLWWPQNEAIIANRLAYGIFGDEKYKNNYEMMLEYAFGNFEDPENGEWYGYLHYDNTVANKLKGNLFKGPFHLPRMLMILADFEENGNMEKFFG